MYCRSNAVLIGVGIASALFHSQNTFSSQLADELGMSLLAYTYLLITNSKYNIVSASYDNNNNDNNNDNIIVYWKKWYPYIVSSNLLLYTQTKWFPIFVATFLYQLSIPVYDTMIYAYKNKKYKQYGTTYLYTAIIVIILSKSCWIYERYLYEMGACPTNMFHFLFYLHSFWHIGTALSHTCLIQHWMDE